MIYKQKNIVILGASNKPGRYSYMALQRLKSNGYTIIPVHPKYKEIDGIAVVSRLQDIKDEIDTLTLYINPTLLLPMIEDIIKLSPRRVIFNPGTESREIKTRLKISGIECMEACTLVLLSTGQF